MGAHRGRRFKILGVFTAFAPWNNFLTYVAWGYLTAKGLFGCPVGVACLPFKFVLTFHFAILTTGIGRSIGL
jgi:hypothetical protein